MLADNPLIFFETIYYAKDKSRVYLFNPNASAFPWYVGSAIVSPDEMVGTLPTYPTRGFVIHGDGTYTIEYDSPIANQILPQKAVRSH